LAISSATAEDPDEQADDATGCSSSVALISDLVLVEDLAGLVPGDNGSCADADLALRLELLQGGQCFVRV